MANSSKLEQPNRIDWIDYAKGIGIFFVVLGHVVRGLMGTPGQSDGGLKLIDTWIYSFHMPFFFFLSGLFAPRANRKSAIAFLLTKARTILYPYVIWSGVVGVLRVVSGQGKKTLLEFGLDFWKIIYQPTDIFWFLYALFLISGLFYYLNKLKVPAFLIGVVSFLLSGFSVFFPEFFFWSPLNRVAAYLIYFVAGAMVFEKFAVIASPQKLSQKLEGQKRWLGASVVLGLILLTGATLTGILVTVTPNLILSFIGIMASLCGALLCAEVHWTQFIRIWGLFSLQIYVAHTAVAALMRVVLFKLFNIDSILIHIVAETFVGLYVPLLLAIWTQKRFPYLFYLPKK